MKITFLGGGNMANALIGGLLKQGFSSADIMVVGPPGGKPPPRAPALRGVLGAGGV